MTPNLGGYKYALPPSNLHLPPTTSRGYMSMLLPTYRNLHNFNQLPIILWYTVFEHLVEFPDALYNIIQVNSTFYKSGIHHLYRHIHFRSPQQFESNESFWGDLWKGSGHEQTAPVESFSHTSIAFGTTSVTIATPAFKSDILEAWIGWSWASGSQYNFPRVLTLLSTFANLRSLTFQGVQLPYEIYSLLLSNHFLHLESLSIVEGTLPPIPEGMGNSSSLPVDTFSSLGFQKAKLCKNQFGHSSDFIVAHLLTTIPTIKSLFIDWNTSAAEFYGTLVIGKFLSEDDHISSILKAEEAKAKSGTLESSVSLLQLETIELSTRPQLLWDDRIGYLVRTRRILSNNLHFFLRQCSTTLRKLQIHGYLHEFSVKLPMPELRVYRGPIEFLRGLEVTNERMEAIAITDEGLDADAFADGMKIYEDKSFVQVRRLEIRIRRIERKLFEVLGKVFPQVEDLTLQVEKGINLHPTETIPCTWPSLSVLHIYDVTEFPSGLDEGDRMVIEAKGQRPELMNFWKHRFPSLDEISLARGLVWKKQGLEDGKWVLFEHHNGTVRVKRRVYEGLSR